MTMGYKSPILAALLTIPIIGAGHMYVGRWGLGLCLFLFLTPITCLLAFILLGESLGTVFVFGWWAFWIWNAHRSALQYNRRIDYPFSGS